MATAAILMDENFERWGGAQTRSRYPKVHLSKAMTLDDLNSEHSLKQCTRSAKQQLLSDYVGNCNLGGTATVSLTALLAQN